MTFLTDARAPGIIPLLDVLYGAGPEIGILMPLMHRDLADDIEDKMFKSWSNIDPVLNDILTALSYLHSMTPPVMHRDIKPENILRDITNKTFLTDLGFMRFCKDGPPYASGEYSHGSNQRATKTYAAPEMLQHGRPHGPAVDVWATGVVAVELMRNARLSAYTDKTARKQLRQICGNMQDPMLKALAGGMLSEDPSSRWTADQVLEYAFITCSIHPATHSQHIMKLVVTEPVFETILKKHVGDALRRLDYNCPQTFYASCAFATEAMRWTTETSSSVFLSCVYACIAAGKLYEHEYWSLENLQGKFEDLTCEDIVRFQNLLIKHMHGRLLHPFPSCITQATQHQKKHKKHTKRRTRRGKTEDKCTPNMQGCAVSLKQDGLKQSTENTKSKAIPNEEKLDKSAQESPEDERREITASVSCAAPGDDNSSERTTANVSEHSDAEAWHSDSTADTAQEAEETVVV